MRSKLDVRNNDELLDGADVEDDAPEPDDDDEPLRAYGRATPRPRLRTSHQRARVPKVQRGPTN